MLCGCVLALAGVSLISAFDASRQAALEPPKPFKFALKPVPRAPLLAEQDVPKVAIIIDDLGHNSVDNAGALSLPTQVAFAILPYGKASSKLSTDGRRRGHELILHLPMQPKSADIDPGPNALMTRLPTQELRERIVWNLGQINGIYAVNNHMGSAFTEDAPGMQMLFEELARWDLAFFDSRTTPHSKSVEMAVRYRVPLAERDVFLDNAVEASAVDAQLAKLEELARKNGSAIAIGHPHQVTFEQIKRWEKTLPGKGLALVPPSEIQRDRATPYWRQLTRADRQKGFDRGAL